MSAEDQIRQFAERIVRLEEERKALAADIKDLKAEAKAAGYSPKLIATCVRIMLMEAEKRAEALAGHEELDLYLSAVGLVAGRPDRETRRDDGGSGYAGSAMAARAAARDEAEAMKVVDRAAQCASATDYVIRSEAAGSGLGEPSQPRTVGSVALRETVATGPATEMRFGAYEATPAAVATAQLQGAELRQATAASLWNVTPTVEPVGAAVRGGTLEARAEHQSGVTAGERARPHLAVALASAGRGSSPSPATGRGKAGALHSVRSS